MDLKNRLKETFLDLIRISEIYPNEKKVNKYVQSRFYDANILWQEDGFRNIIAKIPGKGEPILLSTHLDVPEPNPDVRYIEKGDNILSDGTNILGADPKTGLAILIEFMTDLAKTNPESHAPIEALITRGEESGLLGAINTDYSLISAKIGLDLDEDGPVTQVVTQAPSTIKLDIELIGKIVHPREPEKGVNALQVASEALVQIPWGYSTEGVTWNIGMMESGTARNSVPGRTVMKGELRSYETEKVKSESKKIRKIFEDTAKRYGAKCNFEEIVEFNGYNLEKSGPLFDRLESTFKTMKLKPNYFSTFGGTDANVFNAKGIKTVPIGSGYYNAHEYTEYANLSDMVQITEFLKIFTSN